MIILLKITKKLPMMMKYLLVSQKKSFELKLIYLLEKQLNKDVLNYANELLSEYPDNILAMLMKSKLLCENNENKEALETINKCLKKQKSIEEILFKGDIYVNLKEYQKAIECFDIGIKALDKNEQHISIEWYHKKALCNPITKIRRSC